MPQGWQGTNNDARSGDVRRRLSVGSVGVVYAITRITEDETPPGGEPVRAREVTLVHRDGESDGLIDEYRFRTAFTAHPVSVLQLASERGAPRSVVVAYSTYAEGTQAGRGELRKFVCSEDLN